MHLLLPLCHIWLKPTCVTNVPFVCIEYFYVTFAMLLITLLLSIFTDHFGGLGNVCACPDWYYWTKWPMTSIYLDWSFTLYCPGHVQRSYVKVSGHTWKTFLFRKKGIFYASTHPVDRDIMFLGCLSICACVHEVCSGGGIQWPVCHWHLLVYSCKLPGDLGETKGRLCKMQTWIWNCNQATIAHFMFVKWSVQPQVRPYSVDVHWQLCD